MRKAASVGSLHNLDPNTPFPGESRSRTGSIKSNRSDKSDDASGNHSMMEFAMKFFRFGRYILFHYSVTFLLNKTW